MTQTIDTPQSPPKNYSNKSIHHILLKWGHAFRTVDDSNNLDRFRGNGNEHITQYIMCVIRCVSTECVCHIGWSGKPPALATCAIDAIVGQCLVQKIGPDIHIRWNVRWNVTRTHFLVNTFASKFFTATRNNFLIFALLFVNVLVSQKMDDQNKYLFYWWMWTTAFLECAVTG